MTKLSLLFLSLCAFAAAQPAADLDKRLADLEKADLIVDALLGTGLRGPVEGLLASVIADVNSAREFRILRNRT